jgi:RNA polymerase sigma-70 factor (ECF subfamily)
LEATSHSLLHRAALGVGDSWARLDRLYRPFLLSWFLAQGVAHPDAEDLTQEVMTVLFRELKGFANLGRVGGFRTWLRGVCVHRLQGYRRSRQTRGVPVGGSEFHAQLHNLADEGDDLKGDWGREHDAGILRQLLANLTDDFQDRTLRAFHRLVFDEAPAPLVAEELGISVGAVYIAKSRVLRALRAAADGLIEVP